MKLNGIIAILLVCASANAQTNISAGVGTQNQQNAKPSPVIMAAGKQYKASGWKSMWWGKHYRKEWTTPVSFSVLDLSSFDGGLKPLKAGGGHQSKTLRLISSNGKEYVLRTIDKTLDLLIPEDFKGTFVNDIVNDQISTAHPYGPIAIASMAGSLSFMHTNPVIYYVPDDPLLEEFRTTFANKLCLLEERPSGQGWENTSAFGNAEKIVNTENLLEKVFENNKNQVNQPAFLEVRLFDLIVNDWDRHEDQWIWALNKSNDDRIYTPIARDRDQAFSKTDGINLYFLSRRWAFRPLQSMHSHVRDMRGANFAARNLDRQFLNELSRDEWKQQIEFVQAHLTDAAIKTGINTMPAEVNQTSGDFLVKRLIERRDNLMRDGMRFYDIQAKRIVINGSAGKEEFIIYNDSKNQVSVTGLDKQKDTFYHRVFYRKETKEINIYGLDGDDQFTVSGNSKNRFTIRMIGGEGGNKYSSTEKSSQGKSFRVYDSLYQDKFPGNTFRKNKKWKPAYNYNRASVNYDWYLPLVLPGYNKDDEFSIGLGLLYKKQKWGKTPFGWQQSVIVDYASGTKAIGFGYKGLFKQTFGKWDLDLAAYYKGPRYTFNYYGFGNETELNNNSRDYFRTKGNDVFFSPGISRTWKSANLRLGLQYENVEILRSQNKFATSTTSQLDSSVFTAINFAGINGQWTWSNAGDERIHTNGIQLTGGFSYLNNLDNTARKLLKLNGAVSAYHTFFNRLTFAHRTGATTLFGDYEFYQASTLGGDQNLRGYYRSRFAGKSSFYQNTDLRLNLFNFNGYVVRGTFGVFGFFDDGRVWIKDDNSSKLHTGYGGGMYLVPYKLAVLSLFYGKSDEAELITFRAGFFF